MEGSSVPREEATLPPPPYIYIVSAKDETRELARIELKRGEQGLLVEELLKRTDFDAIT